MTIIDFLKGAFTGSILRGAIQKESPGSKLVATSVPIVPVTSIPIGVAETVKKIGSAILGTVKKLGVVKSIALGAGGIVGINVLTSSPKAVEAVTGGISKAPSALANVGKNIGGFIENPSIGSAKNIFTENPVIAGGAIAASAIVIGKGAIGAVSSFVNTQAVKENTRVTEASSQAGIPAGAISKPAYLENQDDLISPVQEQNAIQPQEIQPGVATPSARRKRTTRKKAITQPIKQTVNIYEDNDIFDFKGSKKNIKRLKHKIING